MIRMYDRPGCDGVWHRLAYAWTVLFVATLVGVAPAAGQSVRAFVTADSVYVGERFTLSLVATHQGASVTFPAASAEAHVFGDLDVIRRTPVFTRTQGSGDTAVHIDSVAYEVATFALDTAFVPALGVRVTAGGDTMRVASAPLYVSVRSTLPPDAQGLRGLAPLATFPDVGWSWWLIGLGTLVVLGGLLYVWYRRRTAREDAAPSAPVPSIPPYEAAQQRLQALESDTDWSDPEAIERCFVALSTTVRTYLARRLGIAALERTTRELIGILRTESGLPPASVDTTRTVLEQADLVKFADRHANASDARTALDEARAAIDAIEHALRTQSALSESSAP